MPSLANHQSNQYVKLLIEGDSKSGKTGSLSSLVCAGYSLRILDYDNGLDVLKQFVQRDCPKELANVEYRTLRDKWKASPTGAVLDGPPRAFIDGLKMLDHWKYDDTDLGTPATWGPDCILVIDSLTFMSDAAMAWRETLAPRGKSGEYDKRSVYRDAQDAIGDLLLLITSESMRTNVILISHFKYFENDDGTKKGYPVSVGSALSPTIPRYFNNVVRFTTSAGGTREIHTKATSMFDLANAAPFKMPAKFAIDNGLAEFFAVLRDPPSKSQPNRTGALDGQDRPSETNRPALRVNPRQALGRR